MCFTCLSGTNTKLMLLLLLLMLVDEKRPTVVIHIGSSDIIKFSYHDVVVNDLTYRILQIGLEYRYYGVESIVILFVLVTNINNLSKLMQQVLFQEN